MVTPVSPTFFLNIDLYDEYISMLEKGFTSEAAVQ